MLNSQKLANWIQVLTGVAVLVGMGLVVLELRQNRELVRAQLSNAGYLSRSDTARVILGETFSATWVRACIEPEKLTEAELFQLYAYADYLTGEVNRAMGYADIGEYAESWEDLARINYTHWLSTKPGRADYVISRERGLLNPRTAEIVDGLIAGGEIKPCTDFFEDYFELARADGDPLLEGQ